MQRWAAQAKPGWLSEVWRTRRGQLFLVPGDSPLGLRLPLQSLPYIAPADYPHPVPADPFAERRPLPDADAAASDADGSAGDQTAPPLCSGRRSDRAARAGWRAG